LLVFLLRQKIFSFTSEVSYTATVYSEWTPGWGARGERGGGKLLFDCQER